MSIANGYGSREELSAQLNDLYAHSKHDRALLKSLAEDNERLRQHAADYAAWRAGKIGVEQYYALREKLWDEQALHRKNVDRLHRAERLIAQHEITIANLTKQLERISRYDLDRNDPLADCAMRQLAKHALEREASNA